ncbi:hypothetical protein GQX74_000077 [Glossina fuscipes]|nr:hypothetical protein GQX74_000077 [Glossina fuscipes]
MNGDNSRSYIICKFHKRNDKVINEPCLTIASIIPASLLMHMQLHIAAYMLKHLGNYLFTKQIFAAICYVRFYINEGIHVHCSVVTKSYAQIPFLSVDLPERKTNEVTTSAAIKNDKENPQSCLERQDTFVKEIPSIDKTVVPVVEETSPTRQRSSKLPTKRQSLTASSANSSPQKTAATRKLVNPISNRRLAGPTNGHQRANSNVNIRVSMIAATPPK